MADSSKSIKDPQLLLGILGGLGPMAGVYFCEMLISHTLATTDKDHINFLLSSRADTPDRSSYIIGESKDDPLPTMTEEARRLEKAGADLIAIPCNTAHHFYEGISNAVKIPVVNIIEQTALFCKFCGVQRIGLLATQGTAASGAYEKHLERYGIKVLALSEEEQSTVSAVIFDQIKAGLSPDVESLLKIAEALYSRGAELVVLGCTELSLLKKNNRLPNYVIDSLELLALCVILQMGKTPQNFDPELMKFYGSAGKDTD